MAWVVGCLIGVLAVGCVTDKRPELAARLEATRERLAAEEAAAEDVAAEDVAAIEAGSAPRDLPAMAPAPSDPAAPPAVDDPTDASRSPASPPQPIAAAIPASTDDPSELSPTPGSPAPDVIPSEEPVVESSDEPAVAEVAVAEDSEDAIDDEVPLSLDPDAGMDAVETSPAEVAVETPVSEEDERLVAEMDELLGKLRDAGQKRDAEAVETPSIHEPLDRILSATVRDERVDYKAIARDHQAELNRYLDDVASTDVAALTRDQQLALYINLYNATMIRAVIDRVRDAPDWTPAADSFAVFDAPLVRLKDRTVSLNQLENEIIRPEFSEPRIHVALVCGARSCPPLIARAYRADDLGRTLDANMRAFLASGFRNRIDRSSRTMHLSKIFEWYAADFGGQDNLANYVGRFVAGDVSGYSVDFIEYHWDLNSVGAR